MNVQQQILGDRNKEQNGEELVNGNMNVERQGGFGLE